MGQLDGKVAAITAGTRGLGRGIAEAYLREGAKVVVNSRSPEKGQKALAEMGAGDRAHFIAGDASKQADVEAVVDGTIEHFGQLDILVLNAGGVDNTKPIIEMPDEEWNFEVDYNLNHTFWGMRRALQHMVPRKSGRIIAMSSIEGKLGKPGIAGYSAVKHGIIGLVKATAREVGTQGITINAICPGIVLTDAFYENGPRTIEAMGLPNLDTLAEIFYKDSAILRPNTVEEVAAMAVFLATDIAGGMTGTAYNVDGGTAPF